MKVKCIIIDDEPLACELISTYISRVPHLDLVATYHNAMDAFTGMINKPVDLIFLDVEMPGMNGFELLRSLATSPQVIVISAHKEHALDGFELSVSDFLLKPVMFERFVRAIAKVSKGLNLPSMPLLENTVEESSNAYLFFKVNKENVKIFLNDILWIESQKDYIKIVTQTNNYTTYHRISNVEEKLPEAFFLRVHRSFIISINKVSAITNTHVRIESTNIPIGKSFKQQVFKKLKP